MFRPSGLTNTARVGQNFSQQSDRSLCAFQFGDRFRTGAPDGSELLGDAAARERLAAAVFELRAGLSSSLGRPTMQDDELGHEAAYSIYQPGASLKRHMDEHHEESKGPKGWLMPSRRSVSWLVYLNSPEWDSQRDGGALRVFTLPEGAASSGVGAHESNLQVGWLRGVDKPGDAWRPVFLDAWHQVETDAGGDLAGPSSQLYVVASSGLRAAISQPFDSSDKRSRPWGEQIRDPAVRARFVALEDHSRWDRSEGPPGWPEGCEAHDVAPRGGALVLFDSVTVPHQVTQVTSQERPSQGGASREKGGSRVALAGWFHEAQQPFPEWLGA